MRIAIVGAGAAGLMAVTAAIETNPTAEIILIDRNSSLGKKVVISGGGRCNVTTGIDDVREVLKRYPRGGKFLSSAIHQFPPADVRAWFEAHGVPIKVEEDLRAFPVSDDGHDVVGAFKRMYWDYTVRLILENAVVATTAKPEGGFIVSMRDGEQIEVDRLILTTGGQAYRYTGSVGDGYAFAESLGHTITKLAPSLNSFFTLEVWPKELSGVSFERAKITADIATQPNYTGPFLFTHTGISGPAVFAVSSLIAFENYTPKTPLKISIDLFPDESAEAFHKRLEESFRTNAKKDARNILGSMLTKSFAEAACKETNVPAKANGADLTKEQIRTLAGWLKAIPLHVVGRGAGDEFVTAGGVDLKEVDPSTMESKIRPGLFFAGELLDVDGYTGGFNLQASWSTGRLAGLNAAKE